MDRSEATFEAYDDVRIQLQDGRTLSCAPLSIAEAVHYLRMFDPERSAGPEHTGFARAFPGRIGIADVALTDLGIEVAGLDLGQMTVTEGLDVVGHLDAAVASPDWNEAASAKAQVWILEEFPRLFGMDPEAPVAEVFESARKFTEALYLRIYGLARDFYQHQTGTPPGLVSSSREFAGSTTAQPQDSTT